MNRKTAVVVCPGRGTYNQNELGYLARHHSNKADLLNKFDSVRTERDQTPITLLDGAQRYSIDKYTRGDNASPLIFAASYLDALSISEFDVVAVTGNSMGWYIALAVAEAVDPLAGFRIVNTMGTLMQESLIGGQTLYPIVDEDWRAIPGLRENLESHCRDISISKEHTLEISIRLGGMLVFAGNDAGLSEFEASVPPLQGRYPMRLPNHAAFHTHLQKPVSEAGRQHLTELLFGDPKVPLVDGRGAVWYPKSTRPEDLHAYTLGHQVTETYDFTTAVRVAARTFAPDVFIATGPGATLGSAIAQSLIAIDWQDIDSKAAFQKRQLTDPVLIAMGREDQRSMAAG